LSQTAGTVLIIAAVVAVFVAFAIWNLLSDSHADVSGRILLGGGDREAAHTFHVEGELSPVPVGHHTWLAFEVRDLLFPVEPELHAIAGRFTREIGSETPDEPFSLVLMLVGAKGQRAIEYWLLEGGLGEGFPGFDRIPGASELDRVRGPLLGRESKAASAGHHLAPPS
jgi:hypothetical protein